MHYPIESVFGFNLNGSVSNVKSVSEDDELMFTSIESIIIRIPAKGISIQGRNTQRIQIMNIKPGDKVTGMARIKAETEAEKQLKLTVLTARKTEGAEEEIEEEEVEEIEELEELEDIEGTGEVKEDEIEEDEEDEED